MFDGRQGGDFLALEAPTMFLKNAIEKIVSDPATKKNAELKKACESALGTAERIHCGLTISGFS